MTNLLLRWLANALALFLTTYVVGGIAVEGFGAALVAALVLGIVNALIRPVVIFFTLPINILTLGLFTFVVNGLMLWLVSAVVDGFHVRGFWSAVFGSIVLSIFSYLINGMLR